MFFLRLKNTLLNRIDNGELLPGERLESERDLAEINFSKVVPRKNMEETSEGLLPGDIILLWRIQFGTFTTETSFSKYFEYI